MKKIYILLIIGILLTTFSGCSGPSVKTEDGEVSIKDGKLEITDEKGKTVIISNDGEKTEITGDGGKVEIGTGSSLPEGYPQDLIPLYKEAEIGMSTKGENDGRSSYMVMYATPGHFQQVTEYYRNIMKEAKDLAVVSSEGYYSLTGILTDKQVVVMISREDEETSISISIEELPEEALVNNSEGASDTGFESTIGIDKEKGVLLPKDYPEDVIPVIEGKIIMANKEASGNNTTYSILIVTEKAPDEVNKFYEEVFEHADGLQIQQGDGAYGISGDIKQWNVQLLIRPMEEDDFKSEITLVVQKN